MAGRQHRIPLNLYGGVEAGAGIVHRPEQSADPCQVIKGHPLRIGADRPRHVLQDLPTLLIAPKWRGNIDAPGAQVGQVLVDRLRPGFPPLADRSVDPHHLTGGVAAGQNLGAPRSCGGPGCRGLLTDGPPAAHQRPVSGVDSSGLVCSVGLMPRPYSADGCVP